MNEPIISLEAAHSHNRVIGNQGQVPWQGQLLGDSRHWRELVRGHAVIVGEATWRAQHSLRGSYNVVVSHTPDLEIPEGEEVGSIDEAIAVAKRHEASEIFVVGGASIFAQTIGLAQKLYLTIVDAEFPGDRFFPEYQQNFHVVSESEPMTENGITYKFVTLERNK